MNKYYQNDSTAHSLEYTKNRIDYSQKQLNAQRSNKKNSTNYKRNNSVNTAPILLVYLSLGLVTLLFSCNLVKSQTDLQFTKKQIFLLQKDILLMNDEISALKDSKETINLQEVYRIATQELGMVHPSKNRYVYYEPHPQSSINQYQKIPGG